MSESNIEISISEKDEFERNMRLLQQFIKQNPGLPTQKEDASLFGWMMKQTQKRRISFTPRKKELRLTPAGESWLRVEEAWYSKLALAKEFIELHNNLPDENSNADLAKWLKSSLKSLESGINIPPDKKNLLTNLQQMLRDRRLAYKSPKPYFTPVDLPVSNSEADADLLELHHTKSYSLVSKKEVMKINTQWLHMFIRVVIFKEEEGRWPQLMSTDTDERPLAIWCNKMKFKYGQGTLSDGCISYLQGIRFPFS